MSAFRDILIQFILQEINKHSTLETCTLLLKVLRRYFSLLQPSSCQNQDFISEERFKNEEQQKKKHNANLVQNLKITVFSFPLFFFFLLHFAFTCVVFLCTVPARGRARGVYIPSKQACFCTYTAQPKATRFQTLLTHVYCHHQEVAPLNSSTELNFSLLLKTSPWEWGKKNNKVSTSKNCAIFFQRGAHYFWECTKTKTKQDAGGSINTARYFSTTVWLLVFFICSFFFFFI